MFYPFNLEEFKRVLLCNLDGTKICLTDNPNIDEATANHLEGYRDALEWVLRLIELSNEENKDK